MEVIIDGRFSEWTAYIGEHWTSYPGETKVFDIAISTQYLAADIISHLCSSQPMGFAKKHEDVHFLPKTLESRFLVAEIFSVIVECFTALSTLSRISWINRALIPQNCDKSGISRILRV